MWLAFVVVPLVLCERMLGIKQIQSGQDPRHERPHSLLAAIWCVTILVYGLWMVSLLFLPAARPQALGLLAITAIGYALRSNTTLKWILVILTFEGSLRVGMLVSLSAIVWRTAS